MSAQPGNGSDEPPTSAKAPARADVVVVGGGIVGLAVARELTIRRPHLSVCVLERERALATHQSGHNSGVVHAGIYYMPGSMKAKLCVQGASDLYEYCAQRGIAHRRCGKLIVALDASELRGLEELHRRGSANGVKGLRRLDAEGIAEIEPHVAGVAGLHSPNTGIVSFREVALSFAMDVLERGGSVVTGCEVVRAVDEAGALRIEHRRGTTRARFAIFCCGAWSDRLAIACGAPADPRIVPFRGAYLELRQQRRDLVRSLIYPVPDPSLPFLGVHLTRTIDGRVLVGPTALLAGARDAYAITRVRGADVLDTARWPGTWRMLRRWWRTGLTELRHAIGRRALIQAAARYVPELSAADVTSSFAGVRAQALRRDGRLEDDFVFSETPRALHVRNAPSPGATSSLAIAAHVVDEFSLRFANSAARRS